MYGLYGYISYSVFALHIGANGNYDYVAYIIRLFVICQSQFTLWLYVHFSCPFLLPFASMPRYQHNHDIKIFVGLDTQPFGGVEMSCSCSTAGRVSDE